MSADRYSVCPNCKKINTEKIAELESKRSEYFKTKTEAEYNLLMEQIKELKNAKTEETLREDYELILDDDTIIIEYSCSCNVCKGSFNFRKQIDVVFGKRGYL